MCPVFGFKSWSIAKKKFLDSLLSTICISIFLSASIEFWHPPFAATSRDIWCVILETSTLLVEVTCNHLCHRHLFMEWLCFQATDEILEQVTLGLERVGAGTDLGRVCRLPDCNSGFAVSSPAVLDNQFCQTSFFKYTNCKYLFLPIKLMNVPCRMQERRMSCLVALLSGGRICPVSNGRQVCWKQSNGLVLPANTNEQVWSWVILKVTLFARWRACWGV